MFGSDRAKKTDRRLDGVEMLTASLSEGLRNTGTRIDIMSERMQHKVDRDELHALKVEIAEQRGMLQRCLDLSTSVNAGLERVERFLMANTSEVRMLKASVRELNEEQGNA